MCPETIFLERVLLGDTEFRSGVSKLTHWGLCVHTNPGTVRNF